MSAQTAILRLEFKRMLRDRAMPLLLLVFTLLAAYAALAGDLWALKRAQAVEQIAAEADETMALRRANFAAMVAKGEKPNFGLIYATALPFRAALPNAPLAALSAGQAEGYPPAASISPFADPYAIFDRHMAGLENPAVLGAGRFDLAFVIVFLLPLLLIAATYDFWSRDVENGSARLQLAQPVRPGTLLGTRAAMRGAMLLVAATMIATLLLFFTNPRDPAGLALFALVVFAYGVFWIALVILINLFARSSTTAALAAGMAWLAIVILLPAATAAAVDLAAPAPSLIAHSNAVRAAGFEVRAANAEVAKAAAAAKSDRAYPASLWHSRGEIRQRDARLAPLYQSYAAAGTRHRALANAARFVSPAVVAQDALDRIAGTDAGRALAFQKQARAFAGTARALAFDWMDRERLMTLADYDGDTLPRFAFAEPRRGAAIAANFLGLALFILLALGIAARRLRRGATHLL